MATARWASSHLYDPADRAKLRIESGGQFEDLARTGDNTAIIPDPRNDENLVIAGLQCAFIRFHNNAVDRARDHGHHGMSAFAEACRLTTWHYHWIVLHEFLPLIVGRKTLDHVLRKRRFYRPSRGHAFMPVEFQAAAYRLGHSMVRPSYRANLKSESGSTRRSRRRSSTSLSARSRATTGRRCCRSAPSCDSSRGACPRDSASQRRCSCAR